MWKWLVVLAILAGGYYFFLGSRAPKTSETDDTLSVTGDGLKFVFNKKQSFEESLVLFGVGSAKSSFADSYIAGIPSETMDSLLHQYPDLGTCGSKGNAKIGSSVHYLFTVNDSDEVKHALKKAAGQFDERTRIRDRRFCLKVTGQELVFEGVYHDNERVDGGIQYSGNQKLARIENVMILNCL